jgi:tRNA(Ile)-lysidine synthase
MIIDNVKKTIRSLSLFRKGDRVIVGVSGGPDSLVLLLLLQRMAKDLGITLGVAHVDHGLRSGSGRDRDFVKKLAKKLGLEYFEKKLRVRPDSEEAARFARLSFFQSSARSFRANKVALGHNRDDQAETLLMRLIRGSGLAGLSAISPSRRFGGVVIVRPLIRTSRKQIEQYLRRIKIRPRIDPTNRSMAFFRNRVRNELLPLLEKKYNKNIRQILAQSAESIADDYAYIAETAKKASGSRKSINLSSLSRMHPAIAKMTLRMLFNNVKGDTRRLTYQHIKELLDLACNRPEGSIVQLPAAIRVKKSRSALSFYR